jgi:hypothetical protein
LRLCCRLRAPARRRQLNLKTYETVPLNAFGNSHINPKMIADSFNKYFLSVAETIANNAFGNSNLSDKCNKSNEYLIHVFKSTFPLINYSMPQPMKLKWLLIN